MPNAGKSSLFNALTRAGAQAANYPFTTVEPNVAVVGVPDERLERVAATVGARPIVHETIQFHDIAGLVRGAHQGEGLGNKFLANIRETDAILHVVRVHDDPRVVHPEGRVDPLADVDTIETELLFADLEQAERRLERVAKQAKSLDKVAVAEEAWLRAGHRCAPRRARRSDGAAARRRAGGIDEACCPHFEACAVRGECCRGRAARATSGIGGARRAARGAGHRRERAPGCRALRARGRRGRGDARRARCRRVRPRDGHPRGVRAAPPDPVLHRATGTRRRAPGRSRADTRARAAAGAIHTDMERGFVAAEVTPWSDLVDAGGYNAAKRTRPDARRGPRLRDAGRRRGHLPLYAWLSLAEIVR